MERWGRSITLYGCNDAWLETKRIQKIVTDWLDNTFFYTMHPILAGQYVRLLINTNNSSSARFPIYSRRRISTAPGFTICCEHKCPTLAEPLTWAGDIWRLCRIARRTVWTARAFCSRMIMCGRTGCTFGYVKWCIVRVVFLETGLAMGCQGR